MTTPAFETALSSFVVLANARLNEYFERHFPNIPREVISVAAGGRKYAKLVARRDDAGKGGCVYAFVDKKTGEIFKPASWAAPAAHARGNVFSEYNGEEALSDNGSHIRYL